MPPSNSSMPLQPVRARKSVRTPVLNLLPESSKRANESSLDDNSPQPDHKIQSQIPSNEPDDTSKAKTPENDLQPTRSNESGEQIPPMMSPRLLALETSINGEAQNISPRRTSTAYDCFNAQPHLKGHFYSANQLFARGVWIGYLAPERQSQSFRGLPSFHDLKDNYSKFISPHPPTVFGSAREKRNAVCRGCARSEAALIAFREVQFGKKVKLVIMPLDGDDDAGVFAIMLPQKIDRSLHGLQAYRPYEIHDSGMGDTFVNNFMMLTLRNPDSDAGTLETVLAVLSPQERADIVLRLSELSKPKTRLSSTPKPSEADDKTSTALAKQVTAKVEDDESDAHTSLLTERKRRKVSEKSCFKFDSVDHISKSSSACPVQTQTHTPLVTQIPAVHTQRHIPITSGSSKPVSQAIKSTDACNVIPLDLTNEQAERVRFIWPVTDEDDTEIEFVHTLGECKSFGGLLGLLKEDTEAIPSVAGILERTKMWRLTYQLADCVNKAVVARKGTETAFDHLQTTLAQASIWAKNPRAQINIELKSLSRSDPV